MYLRDAMTSQKVSPEVAAPLEQSHCRNCGRALGGGFCSDCGQKHSERVLTLGELFSDVIGEFITWDSKFLRSIRPLLFRPGFLTNEYLAGRRTRYILPTRLYIVISVVVFFLLLGLGPVLADALGPETIARIASQHSMSAAEVADELNDKFRAVVPWVLVLSIPFFALALRLLYIRTSRLYVEHLLFAVHFYAFSLLFMIPLLMSMLLGAIGVLAMVILFLIYLFVAIRRVYDQGWALSAMKSAVLAFLFLSFFYLNIYLALAIALAML
jgi:hypothetical protein